MATLTLTKTNFQTEVLNSEGTILIDFWAPWCGPCRMVSPVVDEVAEEMDTVKVGKVNVDEQPELAAKFNVMSIPTLIVMKNGRINSASVGVKSKKQILEMIGSGTR